MAWALALLLGGCAAPSLGPTDEPVPDLAAPAFQFAPPHVVADIGYEPGIRAAPDGTLILHAHKSGLAGDGTQRASHMWWSRDAGATWAPVPSPSAVRDAVYAFEGDVAFDDAGQMFFLDNYLPDLVVSQWDLGPDGPTWVATLPVAGTEGLDDRPWLEAYGDGKLVLASKTTLLPSAMDLAAGEVSPFNSYRLYRSEDAGRSWTLGQAFPESQWCDVAMPRAAPGELAVLCQNDAPTTSVERSVVLRTSPDGRSWAEVVLGNIATEPAPRFPTLEPLGPGRFLGAWVDDAPGDDAPALLQVVRRAADGNVTVADFAPFAGAFQRPWACAGPGIAALVVYGTRDVQPAPASPWHAYALLAPDPFAPPAAWSVVQLDPEPVSVRETSPGDFFQCTVAPDGAVHVAYLREDGPPAPGTSDYGGAILHVRQLAGPNLPAAPA